MTQKILRSFTIRHYFRRRTIGVVYTTHCGSEGPNTHSRHIHKTFKFKIFCVIPLKAWKSCEISRLAVPKLQESVWISLLRVRGLGGLLHVV